MIDDPEQSHDIIGTMVAIIIHPAFNAGSMVGRFSFLVSFLLWLWLESNAWWKLIMASIIVTREKEKKEKGI